MMRLLLTLLVLLLSACVTNRALPVRYDFDGTRDPIRSPPRLDATIAIAPVTSPRWLRTTALIYRLSYQAPAYPRAYSLSQWVAPPGELLTLRLREWVAAANGGLTLGRLRNDTDGYTLGVALDAFAQIFSTPEHSRCLVVLRATLVSDSDEALAQKTFTTERPAPSPDAAGGVAGLVAASDADLRKILTWLAGTIASRSSRLAARTNDSRRESP